MENNIENNMENNIENQVEQKHHRGRRKKGTMRQMLSNLVLVIAVGVFLFSGFKLYGIFSEYHKGESEYDSLKDIAIQTSVPEVTEEIPEEFKVDFEKLKGINPDVVGWIRFDEPSQISYPVVKGPDNDKYLNTTFEGKSFCEENPYFYIYTLDGKVSTYQVFSVCIVKDISRSYVKQYSNAEDFEGYIDYIRGISKYNVDVEVTGESQIVSLSTCTNVSDDERLLVHGVKVNEKMAEEATSNSEADVVEE